MTIKIFKVGKYPQGRWDRERVQRLVDSYDPEGGIEAPCVVGHESGDVIEGELSLGWVRSLDLNAQGEVWADIEASEQLREWVATRRLGYVSAAILADDEKDEKKPPRLAHVAFLGRTNPQITSTRLPSLYAKEEGGGGLTFYHRKIRIKKNFKDLLKSVKESFGDGGSSEMPEAKKFEEEIGMKSEQEKRELERENLELKARLKEAERKNEEYAARKARTEVKSRLDELIKEGKVLPSSREDFAALALSLEIKGRKAFFAALEKNTPQAAEGHFAKEGTEAKAMSNQEIRAFAASKNIDFEAAVEVLQREGRLKI